MEKSVGPTVMIGDELYLQQMTSYDDKAQPSTETIAIYSDRETAIDGIYTHIAQFDSVLFVHKVTSRQEIYCLTMRENANDEYPFFVATVMPVVLK